MTAAYQIDESDFTKGRRLAPIAWRDIDALPRGEYLVKHLLDRGTMSVVYGPSNCGKTYLGLDLALHVALGWEWHGRKVKPGAALYLALEGGLGIADRLKAFEYHHGADPADVPFYVIPTALNLCDPSADTGELIAEVQRLGQAVQMIVVDTLSRAIAGHNENDSADMTGFVRNCDRIRQETGAHVLAIHHSGKDETKGSRGHSSLRAAVDTEIEVAKDEAGTITATVRKQRDRGSGDVLAFRLEPVEVGMDEDEERVTSCVLVPADAAPIQKTPRLSPRMQQALDALHHCLAGDDAKPWTGDDNIPANMPVIPVETWRTRLKRAGVIAEDGSTSRVQFMRLQSDLKDRHCIGVWDSLVWSKRMTPTPPAVPP